MNSYLKFLKLIIVCYCLVSIAWPNISAGKGVQSSFQPNNNVQDTLAKADSIVYYNLDPTKRSLGIDSLPLSRIYKLPQITLHQYLKGGIAGLYSKEASAEPGTIQQVSFIRGLSIPLLSPYDLAKNKPLIILDGIALIDDPSMVYDVQDYSLQPMGAATSLQAIFDVGNIESIQVLKDYSTAGVYGPLATNGVIYVTTKQARPGDRRISANIYGGFAVPGSVTTMNANSEKNFRRPFYEQYATAQQAANYPAYLSDSSYVNYYGPSNWSDLYYKMTPLLSANAGLSGGGDRSNFRVFAGYTGSKAAADATSMRRYQGAFYINMQPKEWITVSSMLHMTRLDRKRNRSLQERFAETRFFPDQSTPLAPNKVMYGLFLDEYQKVIDDNLNNSMVGKISIDFRLGKNLHFSPRLAMDYNENKRDVFWPSTILGGNNYVSNYFGYNERMSFDNLLRYAYNLENKSSLLGELGFSYQTDANKYNYAVGYKGPNDFIKVNIVNGNGQNTEYLKSVGFIPYYYADRLKQRLLSSYGRITFTKQNQYKVAAMFRRDGSSSVQPDARWFTAYNFDGEYNLHQHMDLYWMKKLNIFTSYGRMGIVPDTDKGAVGPYFNGDLGWEGNKGVFSYNGIGTINRPYRGGWIDYDIPWAYNNLLNAGFSLELNIPVNLRVEYYDKHTKNALINIPIVAESGYQYELKNGMAVRNRGVDLTLDATALQRGARRLGWNMSLNVGYNTNQLTALPNNLQEIVIGARKLAIGKRIDQFWLLKNEGIYALDSQVPLDPVTHEKLTYMGGTAMKAGDPRWVDINNDNRIDESDRQLMGNSMPKYAGGFYSQFTYGGFDLSFQLYFNLGRKIMHANAAKFYDFVNTDESNKLGAVRDITYWEKNIDESRYPRYNPWSAVDPYQAEQDLFMENGSFLKLRNMALGYDIKKIMNRKRMVFHSFYVYLTASNLLTLSNYSGRDPELTDFNGYDYGNGLRFPRNFTLGVRLDF